MELQLRSAAINEAFKEAELLLAERCVLACMGDPLTLTSFSIVGPLRELMVGACTCADEAIHILDIKRPNLVFATEDLEQGYGIDLIRDVKARAFDVTCLLFLRRETQLVVRDALEAGADGVMFASRIGSGHLLEALRVTLHGGIYFPKDVRKASGYDVSRSYQVAVKMSGREREVLELIAQGSTNKEIANRLVLSVETVKSHVSALIGKLGVRDRTAAAVMAIKMGFGGDELNSSLE